MDIDGFDQIITIAITVTIENRICADFNGTSGVGVGTMYPRPCLSLCICGLEVSFPDIPNNAASLAPFVIYRLLGIDNAERRQ